MAALARCGEPLRRTCLVAAIGQFDIGGLEMTFGPEKNQGLDKVFLTIIQPDGSFKAVDKLVKLSSN